MAETSGQAGGHLVRQIGLGSGVAVVVGSTIGSGIFKSPSGIAEQLPGPLPFLLAWIVGGFFVLCGALTLSEVGSAYPYAGGLYVYIREAFGRQAAFLFGWAQLVLIRPSSVGAVAIVFGQHALRLFGVPESSAQFPMLTAALSVGAIVAVGLANTFGVRFGTGVQNITTIAKTAGLFVLIIAALFIALPKSGGHFTPAAPPGSFSLSMFGLALVSTLWAYDGWTDGTYVGGEMTDPRKNLPRATLLGTLAVIGVYLLANVAYLAVFSVQEIGKSQLVAADAMSRLIGAGGVAFIVATVMVSTFGTLNGSVLTSPRLFFAMAEDRLIFPQLATVHPKYKTPVTSTVLVGCLGIAYVLVATAFSGSKAFGTLTDAFVIASVPFYAMAVGSVFVFRHRQKKLELSTGSAKLDDSLVDPVETGHVETHPHAYKPAALTPGFPVVPVLFILSTVFLLANSLIDPTSRIPTLITLAIVAIGVPVFRVAIVNRSLPTRD
ncbi:MAG: amino acid permease [Armatimonadetes bacterium]|nr:amino acid permease [Armatimonadota bacterium]